MAKIYFTIILCFLIKLMPAQEVGMPLLTNYLPSDYNNLPQVFSVTQDTNGLMYFGINGNVMQYDSRTWRTVPIPNKSSIYALNVDDSNTVFVGATNEFGYLQATPHGDLQYKSVSAQITDKTVKFSSSWQLQFLNNRGYIRTFECVISFDKRTKSDIRIYKPASGGDKMGALFFHGNKAYVYQEKSNIYEITADSLVAINHASVFADKQFYATARYYQNQLLVATRNNGLYVYSPTSEQAPRALSVNSHSYFSENDVYFINRVSPVYFAVGSIKKGLLLFNADNQVFQEINNNTFSISNYTRNIYSGSNNMLWITWNKGISRINRNFDLTFWSQHSGINDIVETIVRFDGVLYVGTHQNLLYLEGNQVKKVDNITSGQMWHLKPVKSGENYRLLLGNVRGLYEIKDKTARKIGTSTATVNKICQSRTNPNTIYVTKNKKVGVYKFANNDWVEGEEWENTHDDFRGIIQDFEGNIWLCSFRNGVYKIQARDTTNYACDIKQYTTEHGLPSLKDVMPFEYNGQIIFGTEFGLYQYNENTDMFQKFCSLDEQFCNNEVYSFVQLQNGNVFIAPLENKKADIGYFDSKKAWIYKPFRRIPKMLLRGFYAEENGVVWMGGSEGLYRYDINNDSADYEQRYPILIRRVTIGKDSIVYYGNPTDTVMPMPRFDFKYNKITFEFAATFFDYEDLTRYSYQLEGLDETWSSWTADAKANYTNLREGKYTFRVRALNIYDTPSNVATYTFVVLPPWYRTWLAYLLYVAFIFVLLTIIIKINSYLLRKDKERLENIVNQRTAEIMQQKEEITSIADSLKNANEQIMAKNNSLEMQKAEMQAQTEQLHEYTMQLQKLSIAASETDNAIMIMDAKGVFQWFNDGFTRLYGYSAEEFMEKYPTVFDASTKSDIQQIISQCIETKKSVIYETTGKTKDGEEIWVQTTITPLLDIYNDVETLVAIDSDIRKLKQAEHEIRIKNEQITGSIRYARRIQQAILPTLDTMNRHFETFVLYLPKDIVSGDFYWFAHIQSADTQYWYFAVVDCTGHGVPGAFMSMIGSRLLSEIVLEQKIYETNKILEQLDILTIRALQQEQTENNDGMDVALVRIEKRNNRFVVSFAGARNDMYCYSAEKNEVIDVDATRRSIGGYRVKTNQPDFEVKSLQLSSGDVIYLLSDGLADQNNEKRKRFGTKTIKKLIISNAHLSLQEQKAEMKNLLMEWQKNTEQRDDITLLGIKMG